jgi:hypothetical protein
MVDCSGICCRDGSLRMANEMKWERNGHPRSPPLQCLFFISRPSLMPQSAAPNPQAGAERLEAMTDQAIAACGGDARDAVRALIVANEFLEAQLRELQAAVSNGYARGKVEPVPRDRKDWYD